MNILVVNAGSSSLKFTLYAMENEKILASGLVERIGAGPRLIYKRPNQATIEEDIDIKDHTEGLKKITDKLIDPVVGVIKNLEEVQGIGHRIVHGGEKITKSVILDEDIKTIIKNCVPLAPLHNPPNLAALAACEVNFPRVKNVGVFDTAFHQTMKPEAFLYAVPYDLYKDYAIRRYGFHGTSHHFVTLATSNFLDKKPEDLKIITCHLGNGCSMAAVEYGKVIDTSMGMTPLEGLMMGTRSGDVDAGVVFHMINGLGKSVAEADNCLNKQSGLFGIVGVSDMRDTMAKAEDGNELAAIALEMFARRVRKYIGSYFVLLGGADIIVFTGGIGEWSSKMREMIASKLDCLGVDFDTDANTKMLGKPGLISTKLSKIKVLVMPTNEELMIARSTYALLKA